MRALAYLLGARALDLARDSGPARRPVPEVAMGPLATTEETASAWRRWVESRESSHGATVPADRLPERSPGAVKLTRAPA